MVIYRVMVVLESSRGFVADRDRPPAIRDCIECGASDAMTLMNVARTQPTNIPLLYVCNKCGAMLTIPPRISPLERDSHS